MAAAPVRLSNYTPWPFALPNVFLDVRIWDDHVTVTSQMELVPLESGLSLTLKGVDMIVESVVVDGVSLPDSSWSHSDLSLIHI